MSRPNFFIVGAAKSGTTSLYYYLKQFPEVFLPDVKEPVYFGADLEFDTRICARRSIHNLPEYLRLYEGAGDFRLRGDATVWYLYSQTAAQEIQEFDPNAKIIILLRNPVDVMFALHGEFLWDCNEPIADFAEAIAAQEARRNGQQLGPTTHFRQGLLYEDVVSYADQVERYFATFGRDRIHLAIFDDLVASPAQVLRSVADYLGLDPSFEPTIEHRNSRKPSQLRRINQFFAARPTLRRVLFSNVLSQTAKRTAIEMATRVFGSGGKAKKEMDPQLRVELQDRLRGDVERLSELLGRDLTHWCQTSQSTE